MFTYKGIYFKEIQKKMFFLFDTFLPPKNFFSSIHWRRKFLNISITKIWYMCCEMWHNILNVSFSKKLEKFLQQKQLVINFKQKKYWKNILSRFLLLGLEIESAWNSGRVVGHKRIKPEVERRLVHTTQVMVEFWNF